MACSSRRRRPWRHRLALLAGASLVALGAGEGATRVWGAVHERPGPTQFLDYDAGLGWRNRPRYAGRHQTDDFDVAVCFDAAGARIAADAAAEPPGARGGVLAIGDSTTFGWGVEAEQAFAARLAGRLHVPVRNFGVSGYGTDQQLLQLRSLLAAQAPQLVIVTHQDNDVAEVLQQHAYGRYKPAFEPAAAAADLRLVGAPVPTSWWAEHSELWRTVQKRLGAFETRTLAADELGRGRALVRQLYQAMHQECALHGATLLLVFADAEWLATAPATGGWPRTLDLTATFAALRQHGALSFAHDPHWLPHVHTAIAVALADRITAAGWLVGEAPDHRK